MKPRRTIIAVLLTALSMSAAPSVAQAKGGDDNNRPSSDTGQQSPGVGVIDAATERVQAASNLPSDVRRHLLDELAKVRSDVLRGRADQRDVDSVLRMVDGALGRANQQPPSSGGSNGNDKPDNDNEPSTTVRRPEQPRPVPSSTQPSFNPSGNGSSDGGSSNGGRGGRGDNGSSNGGRDDNDEQNSGGSSNGGRGGRGDNSGSTTPGSSTPDAGSGSQKPISAKDLARLTAKLEAGIEAVTNADMDPAVKEEVLGALYDALEAVNSGTFDREMVKYALELAKDELDRSQHEGEGDGDGDEGEADDNFAGEEPGTRNTGRPRGMPTAPGGTAEQGEPVGPEDGSFEPGEGIQTPEPPEAEHARSLADVIDRVQQRLAASEVAEEQKATLTDKLSQLAQGAADGTTTWESARPVLDEVRQAIHDSRPVEKVSGEEAKSKLDKAIEAIKDADVPEEVKAQLISQLIALRDSANDETASKVIEEHKAERFAHARDKIASAADRIGQKVDDALAAGKIDAATAAALHERLDAGKAAAEVATTRAEMRAAWRGVKSVWVELHTTLEESEDDPENTQGPDSTQVPESSTPQVSSPEVPETTGPDGVSPTNPEQEVLPAPDEPQPAPVSEPADTAVQP